MSMAEAAAHRTLYFGFDAERLLLRLDARGGRAASDWPTSTRCGSWFVEPAGLRAAGRASRRAASPRSQLLRNDVPVSAAGRRSGRATRFWKLAFPGAAWRRPADEPVAFLRRAGRSDEQPIERIPHEGRDRNDRSLARLRTDDVASVTAAARVASLIRHA